MKSSRKLRIGFLVNPIAGMGGPAAWKGSDDHDKVQRLVNQLGHGDRVPALERGKRFIRSLDRDRVTLATASGVMGEDTVKRGTTFGGPVFEIVRVPGWSRPFGKTTAEDTQRFARQLVGSNVDLLVFVGGDGTAADVAAAVELQCPILGVPAGVKMFSGVFARTPEEAAGMINALQGPEFAKRRVDVLDLDEAAYRQGAWILRGQGLALVPQIDDLPLGKEPESRDDQASEDALADWFRVQLKADTLYILGAGSTLLSIKHALGGGTPLGVDAYRAGKWMALDADREALLDLATSAKDVCIVVSPTASQGAILGRGTAQIDADVVSMVGAENVVVVASAAKAATLRSLFVDTGDPELDQEFPSHVRVRIDSQTEKVLPIHRGVPVVRE